MAVRQLYSDDDEVLFQAARPTLLNGIDDVIGRPDLADRAIFLTMSQISDTQRRSEAELWREFDRERPAILGTVLDMAAHGLRMTPLARREPLPRMADFAFWAAACETALWPAGTVARAYSANRQRLPMRTKLQNASNGQHQARIRSRRYRGAQLRCVTAASGT